MSGSITTFTGRSITPLSPRAEQIDIADIAHALSLICRANGHFSRFYSVAQHCLNCAREAKARGYSARVQLLCLLHDASEAYLADIPHPVKPHLPGYAQAEKRMERLIVQKYLGDEQTESEHELVNVVDTEMLVCEFAAMMRVTSFDRTPNLCTQPKLDLAATEDIENEFLYTFTSLKEEMDRGV